MEAADIQRLLTSMETMAQANQALVQQVQGRDTEAPERLGASVTLTNVSVKMDMGESAEERLVNFLQWAEDVEERMTVAGVNTGAARTRVALMWGGNEFKEYATQRG